MPLTDSAEGFSGLRQWSEPLIFDRLHRAYRRLLADQGAIWATSRLHARVWRALISGDMAIRGGARGAGRGASRSEPDARSLAEVDGEIMIELLDVVMARYNRADRTAGAYHLALMELAGRLTARAARRDVNRYKLLAQPLAAQLAIERPRPAAVEAAFKRRARSSSAMWVIMRQVELARLVERRPDKLDQAPRSG